MVPMFIILLVIIIITGLLKSVIKPKNYPPGPIWYPYFGCSNLINRLAKKHGSQWQGFTTLSKQYSTDVLGLKLCNEKIVIVYGAKYIRQVFTEKVFEGRPDNFFVRLRCLGTKMGITFADGNFWREQRQFTVKQLRNVGFGKTKMEKEIQRELSSILKYLEKLNGEPIKPQPILVTSVMNILWTYIAGERIGEEKVNFLLGLLKARSKAFNITGGFLNQLPWCRFILPEWSGYAIIKRLNEQLSQIIEENIERHKKKLVEGTDFMYSFLEEVEAKKEGYTEEQLKIICLDIIIAGFQTTSNVIEFGILTALRNKNIQQKLYDEINQVLQGETPSWSDNSRLVYTTAFLQEIHRYYTVVPLAGPRRALEDTTIGGYFIPKDTTVLIAVGDLCNDPQLWDEPNEFKPERFIDESGALKDVENVYPFGLGRRKCPGDALAKSFIFIVFVGILQKFRIDCNEDVLPSGEPVIGLISGPKPYTAVFTPRDVK